MLQRSVQNGKPAKIRKKRCCTLHEYRAFYEAFQYKDKAIEFLNKSLAINKEIDYKKGEGECYVNLALVYRG